MQGIRIFGESSEKRDFVSAYEALPGYDFLKLPRATDVPIEVLVAPDQLEQFKNDLNAKDIKFEVAIPDVSKILEQNLVLQNRARKTRVNSIFKSFPSHAEVSV